MDAKKGTNTAFKSSRSKTDGKIIHKEEEFDKQRDAQDPKLGDGRKRESMRKRRRKRLKLKAQIQHRQQQYGAPPPPYLASNTYSYSPTPAPEIIYQDRYPKSQDVTPALLGLLPLVLLGGLALGFLNPFNLTLSSSSSSSSSSATRNSVTSLNVVNMSSSSITNIFIPTNAAKQNNTQNETVNINIYNNTNNNAGRSFQFVDLISQFPQWVEILFELLGTSRGNFLPDLLHSATSVSSLEVLSEMTTLGRKMYCVNTIGTSGNGDCREKVVCEHLAEDEIIYGGNVMVRAGEIFSVMLYSLAAVGDELHVVQLAHLAAEDNCSEAFPEVCKATIECQDII